MTIQCVFNTQKWGNEATSLAAVKFKLEKLTKEKMVFEFLPAEYSFFENIPYVVIPFPFTSELGESPDPKWFKEHIYPLNREADVLIFIIREHEWPDNETVPGRPYGYAYPQYPITAPPFISILAESGDKSWKFKKMPALEHYIPHELAHAFSNFCGIQDRTHELDYKGKIQELYDLFDYDKIKLVLSNKRKLDGAMANFYYKDGDPTIFASVEGLYVGFSTNEAKLRKDWPTAKFIKLAPDELLKASMANEHTLAQRK